MNTSMITISHYAGQGESLRSTHVEGRIAMTTAGDEAVQNPEVPNLSLN